jgi:hypothetical protein
MRLGRTLDEGEVGPVEMLLEAATAVVAGAAGKTDGWAEALSPVPALLRFVTVEIVCRALANPQGIQSLQEGLGAHSSTVRFRDEGGGLWLTAQEARMVRHTVYGSSSGSVRIDSIIVDLDECS